MGGEIGATSEPGRGSKFSFTLVGRIAPERKDATPPLPGQVVLADREVAIVDDNATNRRIFATLVRRWQMKPREFEAPRDFLASVQSGAWPDLLLTDMAMPLMDGLELAGAVRALEKVRHRSRPLPIILASSGGYRASD